MRPLDTPEVLRLAGISQSTLDRWLAEGKVPRPKKIQIGVRRFRLWTKADLERVKRHKAKFYRKGRGRKPKKKR